MVPNRNAAYGRAHRELRARLLPLAFGRPCPKCGRVMLAGQQLDLDHVVPLYLGVPDGRRQIAHARCNRSEGGRVGGRLRGRQQQRQVEFRSRW